MAAQGDYPDQAELLTLLQEQRRELEALRAGTREREERLERRIAGLEKRRTVTDEPHRASRKRLVSRANLLKGAAASVAGLATAELSGSLTAVPVSATTTDTNFVATAGSGYGVQVGGQSATDYGYNFGGVFYGRDEAIAGTAVDGTGAFNGGTGVRGNSGSGSGVVGFSAIGPGVLGDSGSYVGGSFRGGLAPIYLQPHLTPGPPTTGNHSQGEIVIDNTGVPYICSAGNGSSLGTWQAIGNLRTFPNPRRVFGQAVSANTGYLCDPTKKLNGTSSGVPGNAAAIYAAVQSDQPGRLTLYPAFFPDPGIANWTNNGTAGILCLSYMFIPVNYAPIIGGGFAIHSYLTGNVYVDVCGYLL